VAALLELIRLRNAHPAFGGDFELGETPADQLLLRWRQGAHLAQLEADFTTGSWSLRASAIGADGAEYVCTDSSVLQR
jgi:sucrose phosphorylase